MLQIIMDKFISWFRSRNRWWVPLTAGFSFSLCLPPFNHELSPSLLLFPFLSFIILIPLLGFSVQKSFRRSLLHTYLFSVSASLGQYYWIGFVTAEGLWHLILIGLILISAGIGLLYLSAGMLFRFIYKRLRRLYIIVFPAVWVLIDFFRSVGDISFPWGFLGYSMTPVLPLAQIASFTGVWGLTYLIVLGNMLVWDLVVSYRVEANRAQKWIHLIIFTLFLTILGFAGLMRMNKRIDGEQFKVSLLQTNIDQFNWGNKSLDTAFSITEAMVYKASEQKPGLIVGPESALLCYLSRRPELSSQVLKWADSTGIPLILGALHWEKSPEGSFYDYLVYNSAFMVNPLEQKLQPYHKIKLVPFSEAIPFEGKFPILSRVNLGEADFQRGSEATIFNVEGNIKAAPFICYEIIYPGFVQNRVKKGADLIVAITNDGWFGKSSGPFHHAAMARMRAVENGLPLVRSANSGISMIVDQYGRVLKKTGLYERTILTGEITPIKKETFYSRWGDWFVSFCLLIIIVCSAYSAPGIIRRQRKMSAKDRAEEKKEIAEMQSSVSSPELK